MCARPHHPPPPAPSDYMEVVVGENPRIFGLVKKLRRVICARRADAAHWLPRWAHAQTEGEVLVTLHNDDATLGRYGEDVRAARPPRARERALTSERRSAKSACSSRSATRPTTLKSLLRAPLRSAAMPLRLGRAESHPFNQRSARVATRLPVQPIGLHLRREGACGCWEWPVVCSRSRHTRTVRTSNPSSLRTRWSSSCRARSDCVLAR
jgi:hypothetical protein